MQSSNYVYMRKGRLAYRITHAVGGSSKFHLRHSLANKIWNAAATELQSVNQQQAFNNFSCRMVHILKGAEGWGQASYAAAAAARLGLIRANSATTQADTQRE